MRLERVVPAVAITILLSSLPSVASESGDTLSIVSPSEGDFIGPRASVTLAYNTTRPFAMVSGYLTLDGEWAGSFSAPSFPGGRFAATLNATGFASGPHALGAVAFTNDTAPVEATPVPIVLDHPAALTADAAYDLDARTLRVSVTVDDDGPTAPTVSLSEKNLSVAASFFGTQELALPIVHGPGNYVATLRATDALNQTTRVDVRYVVSDREADIDVHTARYELGGRFRFEATATDADGGVRFGYLRVANSTTMLSERNGTFSADVYVDPTLGVHHASFQTVDVYDGSTTENFTFVIDGPREVFFERTIETTYGSYENVDAPYLPALRDGLLEICVNVCGMNVTYVGSATVVAAIQATNVGKSQTCSSTGASRACAFDTAGVGGWNLDLAWKQQFYTTVTVRVTGVRV